MTASPRIGAPFLEGNQAQKYVTLNEALGRLDALVQLAVISAAVSERPSTPEEGDLEIVPEAATGNYWETAAEGYIAAFFDGVWLIVTPQRWCTAFDRAAGMLRARGDSGWQALPVLHGALGGMADDYAERGHGFRHAAAEPREWEHPHRADNNPDHRAVSGFGLEPLVRAGIGGRLGNGDREPAGSGRLGLIRVIACPQCPAFLERGDAFLL